MAIVIVANGDFYCRYWNPKWTPVSFAYLEQRRQCWQRRPGDNGNSVDIGDRGDNGDTRDSGDNGDTVDSGASGNGGNIAKIVAMFATVP